MRNKKLAPFFAFTLLLGSCATREQFIERFTDHPSARIHCADVYEKEAEEDVKGTVGDANYEACLEQWALEQAEQTTKNINECVMVMSLPLFTAPFVFVCFWALS
ncbi:MAG: hypothetical protein V6Z81_06730 [Parvularculales bacterium]